MRSLSNGNELSSTDECRSLICDANGVIVGETVYRCMRCGVVSDSIRTAKSHYYALHIGEDEEFELDHVECFPEDHQEECLNLSKKTKRHSSFDEFCTQEEKQLKRSKSASPDCSNGNASLAYGTSLLTSEIPELMRDAKDEVAKYLGRDISDSATSYDIEDSERNGNSNQLPRDMILPRGSSTGAVGKAGHISCAVCGVVRYYSCVYRRYGQFTCQVCYRFFRTFFGNPKIYVCNTLGECPLNVRNRCRACWIKACIEVYSIDGDRREIALKHLPTRSQDSLSITSECANDENRMQPNVVYHCSSQSSSSSPTPPPFSVSCKPFTSTSTSGSKITLTISRNKATLNNSE